LVGCSFPPPLAWHGAVAAFMHAAWIASVTQCTMDLTLLGEVYVPLERAHWAVLCSSALCAEILTPFALRTFSKKKTASDDGAWVVFLCGVALLTLVRRLVSSVKLRRH
jgi:hypothetical protein